MSIEPERPSTRDAVGWHHSVFGNACRLINYSFFAFLFWRNVRVDRAGGQSDRLDLLFACLSTALTAGAVFGLAAAIRKWWVRRVRDLRAV